MLDLDGTLVSSFTPKRAPRLPSYIHTHTVGQGSKLNPQVTRWCPEACIAAMRLSTRCSLHPCGPVRDGT
jgi:hypothetical protein